jgi:hypothetical protein
MLLVIQKIGLIRKNKVKVKLNENKMKQNILAKIEKKVLPK